jgi:hypothetical protein
MKIPSSFAPARCLSRLLVLAALFGGSLAHAYPPAPFHLFYGMLRDEYGTPINQVDADVVLETASGVKVKTRINPGIESGANYRLEVPMDAGLLAAPYQATALRPFVPFQIKVQIGKVTYLPIETRGDFAALGQPGQRTRLNLTLGEDSNGDGLPDAWQRLVNADLSKVRPDADAGNGLTYLDTYLAGTYAVDPAGGFVLNILGVTDGATQLEFVAVTGRTYALVGSRDLKTWEPVRFRIPAEGANAPIRANLLAGAIKRVQVEAVHAQAEPAPTYYRLVLQ